MTIEKGPQKETIIEKAKITPLGFKIAANTYLDGTNMLELIDKTELKTDKDGNIEKHVVQNIKTMLQTAVKMAPDEGVRVKFQNLLTFMEDY